MFLYAIWTAHLNKAYYQNSYIQIYLIAYKFTSYFLSWFLIKEYINEYFEGYFYAIQTLVFVLFHVRKQLMSASVSNWQHCLFVIKSNSLSYHFMFETNWWQHLYLIGIFVWSCWNQIHLHIISCQKPIDVNICA